MAPASPPRSTTPVIAGPKNSELRFASDPVSRPHGWLDDPLEVALLCGSSRSRAPAAINRSCVVYLFTLPICLLYVKLPFLAGHVMR